MNQIFHYYITGFLAMRAGFSSSDAGIIATSAQYVDHALIPYRIHGNDSSWHGKGDYIALATHHFGFWDPAQEESVWIPFHFFPAGLPAESNRRDGARDAFAVRPDSEPARELLVAALKTNDLFRIGIALHTYADTWAHQNYTGKRQDFNRMHAATILPPIGHAHAESSPDIMHARWLDPRLIEARIDNRTRFLDAARMIYKYLATNRRRAFKDLDFVIGDLEQILGPVSTDTEAKPLGKGVQANIRKGIDALLSTKSFPLLGGKSDRELEFDFQIATGFPPYDRTIWRKEAFQLEDSNFFLKDDADGASLNDKAAWLRHEITSRTGIKSPQAKALPGFFQSNLYHWSEAAREHLQSGIVVRHQI